MKKLFLSLALFFAVSTTSFAFYPQMNVFVNREVATARIFNTSFHPMVCSGTAFGQTYSGMILNSWFGQVYVTPGMFADVYVHTNFYDPFVRAWANVDCRYTRY